jgi:phospholipid-binding lipoprotein MlaA
MKKVAISALLTSVLVTTSQFAVAAAENDPLESLNQKTHRFNEFMDQHFLLPVARGYTRYIPAPARQGVRNFFYNIGDVSVLANNLLQVKLEAAASDAGRIMINTTVGVFGIFDIATPIGFNRNDEDFGQTLGYWGIGPGPYLVLPLFGPSTLRDSFGLLVDTATNPINHQDNIRVRNSSFALEQLDRRVAAMSVEALITGDPYIFTREAYLQQRQYLVNDGEVDESWDDDWDDWD